MRNLLHTNSAGMFGWLSNLYKIERMSLCFLDSLEKYPHSKVITFIFYLELLSTDWMKHTLLINHLLLKPIQTTVEVEEPVPKKAIEIKEIQTSRSGKFCKANITAKESTSPKHYLTCSWYFYS